jgi:hypothetical protein
VSQLVFPMCSTITICVSIFSTNNPNNPNSPNRGLHLIASRLGLHDVCCRQGLRAVQKKDLLFSNLQNKSLISAARGTKATHKLTILRSYLSRIQRICPFRYLNLSSASAVPLQCYDLGHARERGYVYS